MHLKIHITDEAAQKIISTFHKYNNENYKTPTFRIDVVNAGCGGMAYKYGIDKQEIPVDENEELYFISNGIKIIIKKSNFEILNDITLDYVDELIGSHFEITNPNAKANCGCGKSFNIKERKIQKNKDCIVD